ncbi:MAG: class I SAM-dependent methyltransferase [Pirellulales bacterium]
MAFLSQTKFPWLWDIFQMTIGGTHDKRKMMAAGVQEGDSILEIGCAVGNITPAFLKIPNTTYCGLDIDENALNLARNKFAKHDNCEFILQDLTEHSNQSSVKYDYILFAGMCHHITDDLCVEFIQSASRLLSENGAIYVVDPLIPRSEDSLFLQTYMKHLEQGEYLRENEAMKDLFDQVEELNLVEETIKFVNPTPFPFLKCTRYGIYKLEVAA